MNINPGIFKAYDIRGVYDTDFNDETAYKIGLAYCEFRKKELGRDNLEVVVACDMRISSPVLKDNLIKGLNDGGADVVDIDLASTPTFYFAVANYGYDGGIIVSASHNPKEYNGFKLVKAKAFPIGAGSGMEEMKELVLNGDLKLSEVSGKITEKKDVLSGQVEHDLKFANIEHLKKFKIAIDPANAMGAQYFEELFKHLPCELVKMNWELDGTFPSHEADPFNPENLVSLSDKVVEENCDLGIATDGDGDRVFFVDNTGAVIDPGITRAVLSKIFLNEKPGSKIAYDIRPGRITRDVIVENGGEPIVTKVGHSLIKQRAIKEGAYFAGESSGHFFLNMEIGCFEVPMIVVLKMLEELSESEVSSSEYIEPYQKYYNSGEINSVVADPEAKIQEIKEKNLGAEQNDLDGITVEYEDYWFNVRSSNTEPLLRLNLEAHSKEVMEKKRDEVLKMIRE